MGANAAVEELVYSRLSKGRARKGVWVRIPPAAFRGTTCEPATK